MFSIKAIEKDNRYTVYECNSYNVGKTSLGLRSISFWIRGSGSEPGLVIVGEGFYPVAYIMNDAGKTIDTVWPFPPPETAP